MPFVSMVSIFVRVTFNKQLKSFDNSIEANMNAYLIEVLEHT